MGTTSPHTRAEYYRLHDYDEQPARIAKSYGIGDIPQLFKRERPAGRLLSLDGQAHDQPIMITESRILRWPPVERRVLAVTRRNGSGASVSWRTSGSSIWFHAKIAERLMTPSNRLFCSFWQAGFECACQINSKGVRLDMTAALQHDLYCEKDYKELREAHFAEQAARILRDRTDQPAFYSPMNEISFFAWAAARDLMFPYAHRRDAELKRQLVRAALAAIDSIWSVDPRARIISPEPSIHTVPPIPEPWNTGPAEIQRNSQFEAWDMLSGRAAPELGGAERYLDIIGLNFYSANEWEVPGGRKLAEVYNRYGRPRRGGCCRKSSNSPRRLSDLRQECGIRHRPRSSRTFAIVEFQVGKCFVKPFGGPIASNVVNSTK